MTRAAIYVRISRDAEGTSLGVARQEEDARDLAARRGWDVVNVYRDNDISASGKKSRPGWESLLRDIEAGEIEAVAAYSSSRLYRNLRDLGRLIELADAGRVQVGTVASGDVDVSTADGRMVARILASVDQREWEAASERRLRQRKQARLTGKWNGGRRPFGLRPVPRPDGGYTLEPDPKESALVREAASRILSGGTLAGVAQEWNRAGITTTGGKPWRAKHIGQLLQLPTLSEHGVLTLSDQERLVEMFDGRKLGRIDSTYVLSGLVFCEICGGRMTGTGGRYACREGGVHNSIRQHHLEPLVEAELAVRPEPNAVNAHDPSEPLVQRREAIERDMEALGESDLPTAVIRGRARKLQRQLDAIDAEIVATPAPKVQHMDARGRVARRGALPVWAFDTSDDDPIALRRQLVERMVERVTVAPAPRRRDGSRVGRDGFDPERVRIDWR